MMGNDEGNRTFHDFLGTSSADSAAVLPKKNAGFGETPAPEASVSASVGASSVAYGSVSGCSDLGSERQTGNHFEGVHFRNLKNDYSAAEIRNMFLGRKRSNSDSGFVGSVRDRMHQMGMNSARSSHLEKLFPNEVVGDRPRRSHDDDLLFSMQPPRSTSTPVVLQPPINGKHEPVVSSWGRILPVNPQPVMHYPSCLGQFSRHLDKFSSSRYSDTTHASASTSLSYQSATDEGSITGIKGSSILNASANSAVPEKNPTGLLPGGNRPKVCPQHSEIECENPSSRHCLTSISRQMTIFYAGQAHVFDEIHPNKADEIMSLARSNGGSWSTTYSLKSSMRRANFEAYAPTRENEAGINSKTHSQDTHSRLSFLRTSHQRFTQGEQLSTPGDLLNL